MVETTDTTESRGTVVDQEPGEGERADEGDVVTIVVSAFEEPTETPSPTEEPSPTETPGLPTESPAALTDPNRPGRQGGQRMGSA